MWPDEYDPARDNPLWAADPLGTWRDCPSYQHGIYTDTGIQPCAFNYMFMALYDQIPCEYDRTWKTLIFDIMGTKRRGAEASDKAMQSKRRNFYGAMVFIKKYPTYDEMKGALGLSRALFCEQIRPTLYCIARHIDFMDFNLRLWDWNHSPHFQERVLTVVDGFPVKVSRSENDFIRRLTRSGKYKDFVVKGDILICLATGCPVDFAWTHQGVMNDARLWRMNMRRKSRLYAWEYVLGDKAYIGCPECVCEYKGVLTPAQRRWNVLLQHYRARVEHTIAQFNTRKAISSRWKGSFSLLSAIMRIVVHTIALQERMLQPKYPAYGPWAAAPPHVVAAFPHPL